MNVPENLRYTKEHEWVYIDGDIATIGITDFAQAELGDIIFVEFINTDSNCNIEDAIATIEAVKTVADLYAPIDGKVVEVNNLLETEPDLVNSDPYKKGWILKIKISSNNNFKSLLKSNEYIDLIK